MNLKIIIIGTVVTFTLLFGGLFWLSRPATKPEIAAASIGRLTAAETFYDFGSVSMAKGLVAYKFTVTNSDSVPAVVTKLYTSCMCTKAALDISGKFGGHLACSVVTAEPFLPLPLKLPLAKQGT